ncbi:HesA/MoeB/ThiF family protein [Paracoccus homiensis]|uniref:HesA/MoeB/ThiF family protein n=1 Tax=Paracoccus homiensis TaxID=364199 RepID=UPI00398CD856
MLGLWLLILLVAVGRVFRLPRRVVVAMLACLWLGIVLLLATAPGSAAAAQIGGSAQQWLVAGAALLLILLYRAGLRLLRSRAEARAPHQVASPDDGMMSDAELDRYARHLVLREIGGPGQMRLRQARVLIVGAGGLGSPVCLYLAAVGVGHITLADDDTVSLSNLQRQVIFRADQRGLLKVDAAASAMSGLNAHVSVAPHPHRITEADRDLIAAHDLVIDGTDGFAARAGINVACVAAGVPLIAGAITQWEGQVTLYDPARGGPCMACLFPVAPALGLAPPCAEAGVIGPLPGVIGSLMALEAIKHLTGAGQGLRGQMMIFDGLYGETRMIRTTARGDCAVCGQTGAGPLESGPGAA